MKLIIIGDENDENLTHMSYIITFEFNQFECL